MALTRSEKRSIGSESPRILDPSVFTPAYTHSRSSFSGWSTGATSLKSVHFTESKPMKRRRTYVSFWKNVLLLLLLPFPIN